MNFPITAYEQQKINLFEDMFVLLVKVALVTGAEWFRLWERSEMPSVRNLQKIEMVPL